jgi:hypothetical protein
LNEGIVSKTCEVNECISGLNGDSAMLNSWSLDKTVAQESASAMLGTFGLLFAGVVGLDPLRKAPIAFS